MINHDKQKTSQKIESQAKENKLRSIIINKSSVSKICKKCKSEILGSDLFCPICGVKLQTGK